MKTIYFACSGPQFAIVCVESFKKQDRIVKTVSWCRTSICRKLYLKIQKEPDFYNFAMKFTANPGPAQRNCFHYPILVFMLNLIMLITHTSGEVH